MAATAPLGLAFAAIAGVALVLSGGAAWACNLPAPKGDVVLVVQGMINECNQGLEVHFDREMFDRLPQRTIRTQNPWDHGTVAYQGVLLRDLMKYVDADGTVATISALNDFRADLSLSDMQAYDVILADKRDGKEIPVRDKGPFFVVFPFSEVPALATEARYAQSVWQVNQITVK